MIVTQFMITENITTTDACTSSCKIVVASKRSLIRTARGHVLGECRSLGRNRRHKPHYEGLNRVNRRPSNDLNLKG